jgi:hypothetical protein
VSLKDRELLAQLIEHDSLFFREHGLIDYSLIVIKVDHAALTQQEGTDLL